MPIQHEDNCVPDVNPLQCAYYNKDHKIVNMLGYELVEEKELPAGTTTCTFNNLDGNEDEKYLIEFNGVIINTTPDNQIKILLNNISSNSKATVKRVTSAGQLISSYAYMTLLQCGYSQNVTASFTAKFWSKTGRQRIIRSDFYYSPVDGADVLMGSSSSLFNDLVTNVTSIVISSLNNSFSGTIRLWKRIPLDGGV